MNATAVVIDSERFQILLQIERIPEKQAIEILAAQGADQPFDEWMRYGNIGNRLDFVNFEYPQVREPSVEAEEWVVIGCPFRKLVDIEIVDVSQR